MTAERIETTYADLRPTDLVIDKAGNTWPIAELRCGPVGVTGDCLADFWLCDPVTRVKMHWVSKNTLDAVTVSRVPSHADEAAKLEADFPAPLGDGITTCETCGRIFEKGMITTGCESCFEWRLEQEEAEAEEAAGPIERNAQIEAALAAAGVEANDLVDAVMGVNQILGGEVEAVVTAEEVDAASAATDDAPLQLPPFADMTPLEQRSHLYLLHGVLAYDMKSAAELQQMHGEAHGQHDAGTLHSAHIPHTHDGSF